MLFYFSEATMPDNVFTRFFFGAPDQDYRGEPNEANDRLVDKIMNCAAAVAVVGIIITTCML